MNPCILCGHDASPRFFDRASTRSYCKCEVCDLWFLRPADRLSLDQEKAHYAFHNNDVDDPRYQKFVSPLQAEIAKRHPTGSRGLDFGAGPGPVLKGLLEASGFNVDLYDPIFHPEKPSQNAAYDFIVSSEVVEHFFTPQEDFCLMRSLLRPGGTLAIMTLLVTKQVAFEDWSYRLDPTHVAFYSADTFSWIQRELGFSTLETDGKRLVILRR